MKKNIIDEIMKESGARVAMIQLKPSDQWDSYENFMWYADHAKSYLETQQNSDWSELQHQLVHHSNATLEQINALSIDEKKSLVKKLITLLKKEAIDAKREITQHQREEKLKDNAHKLLQRENLDVTYKGDADKKLLSTIINDLKLQKFLKPKSKVELYSRSRSERDPNSTNRYEFTNIYSSGYIIIDGIEHKFDDIKTGAGGYDYFPPS